MKNLLKITDLNKKQIQEILDLSVKLNQKPSNILKNKNILFAFEKPSLRTRASAEVAINHLGGNVIFVEPEIFFNKREGLIDTVQNVNQWCDAIFARVFSHDTLEKINNFSTIPIVNALCDKHHPMQALADLLTIQKKFGKNKKIICAYIGDANNVAFSLLEVMLKFGHVAHFAGPKKYFFNKEQIKYFENLAKENKTKIIFSNNPIEIVKNANVVYTDTFVSMGEESIYKQKIKHFKDYKINKKLFSHTNKNAGFMHCLPAYRGIEVTEDVIDGPNSWIYAQAKNRMVVTKGVFAKLFNN